MREDYKFWLVMTGITMLFFLFLIFGSITLYTDRLVRMAELGYQCQPVVGSSYNEWQKIGKEK